MKGLHLNVVLGVRYFFSFMYKVSSNSLREKACRTSFYGRHVSW